MDERPLPRELLDSIASIQTSTSGNYSGVIALRRLAPRLKFVDDFSAVLALCFGADATLTATVWGSIRIILGQAASTADTLQDILDMLEDLSLTLPRFQIYERTLPLNRQLQHAIVDVYGEIICFYARTIYFLRSNPHLVLRKNAWQTFQKDFARTILRIKRMSSVVESEADMARMRQDESRYKEVLEFLNAMKIDEKDNPKSLRFNNIPFPKNPKFSGRKDMLAQIQTTLNPASSSSSMQSMALFGMGGVGKTQTALQFAYQSLDDFEVVLWVAADNAISIGQSFGTIASELGLLGGDDEKKDPVVAIWKTKNWLNSTQLPCLLIFDNADDLGALKKAWPASINGAILLTTRDFEVATTLAAKYLQVEPLNIEEGSNMLLKAVGLEDTPSSDTQHAVTITKTFGGLPLALSQIGGFINQRKLSLQDFLPLYEKYSTRIDARKASHDDYEYTLSTVWNVSFEKLSEEAAHLLSLLSFFDPDSISEEIMLHGSQGLDGEFSYLSDEFSLGDSAEELLRAALVTRARGSSTLSIHRLVQSAARKRLDKSTKVKYFDAVAHMLGWGFPDHASVDIGHQMSTWSRCEKCVPHVNYLVDLAKTSDITPSNRQKYAELLLRCSWYLYEGELYSISRSMIQQAIETFDDTSTLAYASAIDLGGLIDLDMARPSQALAPFKRALDIRLARLGAEDPFIAYSLNNIALAYTEMGELDLAYKAHEDAISLRLKAKSDRIGNSYSNMSSLLLRMNRPDEAEEILARCPELKDFSDETFLSLGNPRWSGDMVLLSRIRMAQGRVTEAIRLSSKALAFRQSLLGERLKTCDSRYDLACMLLKDGHESLAARLLEEIVSISETFVEGEGQRARALYKLSIIYNGKDQQVLSEAYREKALQSRAAANAELKDAPFEEAEFAKLCLWMLW
ncbi:uncharacterized protein E0L32_003745 [Thyridium curvatum]|uniref:Uncharacterized protein n=1 Tax=Thyridium curvatum TaxID=1093900 RepID=A0A507BHI0_9PEZI|nr:uncharacterized protein E0L32_003745 [Thyridium curvatum]TPX16451.1 hypothetical protein E0L32_003745 [Thyridium curvatum]